MATYKETVNADAPYLYFDWDADTTNRGSGTGATAVGAGGVTLNQTPAANIPGKSAVFGSGANSSVNYTNTGQTIPADWTFETWYKNNLGMFTAARHLFRVHVSASVHWYITITGVDGYLRVYDNAGVNNGIMDVTMVDGNWHHLVVTKSASVISFYRDGQLTGTISGTVGAKTGGTIYTGGYTTANSSSGAYLDETAFYRTTLSAQRVLDHYNAGIASQVVTNVKVTPPPMTMSVPTQTVTVKTTTDKRIAAPAMSLSVTSPTPAVKTGVRSVATPMVASLTMKDALVTTTSQYDQTVTATLDRAQNGQGTVSPIVLSSNASQGYFYFESKKTPQTRLTNATLTISVALNNPGNNPLAVIFPLGDSFTEDGTGLVSGIDNTGVVVSIINGTNTFSLSEIVSTMNDGRYRGIGIAYQGGGTASIVSREGAVANRPKLRQQLEPQPINLRVNAPAMGASLAMPDTQVRVTRNINTFVPAMNVSIPTTSPIVRSDRRNQVTPMSVSLSTRPANVSTTGSRVIAAPAMSVNLAFSGGKENITSPNTKVLANPFVGYVFTPNPEIKAAKDAKIVVGTTMNGEIKMTNANVNLKTDSTIPAGPMNVTLTWVGLYDRDSDRYIKALPPTLGLNDVWLEMDEASGTVAKNSLVDSESNDATYVGSPSLRVTGPFLRKAARFDGVDDYLRVGTYDADSIFSSMDSTIEFSIRTDALNGTVFAGSGISDSSADATSLRSELRLVNGELVIIGHNGEQLRVRKNISDGKWHHVVVSVPSVTGGNLTSGKPHFVMIDGVTQLARYGITYINGRTMLPASAMARLDNNYVSASNFLAGDMRDMVVRLNSAISQDVAQKLYYEWSNSVIISPPAAQVNVSMPDNFLRISGNVKKMLVVYGLPYNAAGQTFGSDFTYASIFAGYLINNGLGAYSRPRYTPGSPGVLTVRPFYVEGYLAYPVSIEGGPLNDAPGTSKRDNVDENGYYIDDRTGLPRFINLQDDLIDVTQYDAVTVVNYPAARIDGGIFGDGSNDMYTATVQGMNLQQHTTARDALRDSILQAAYDGANLWIPEIHMAEHLGFIQGFDKHSTGEWSDQQGLNVVADQLDQSKLLPSTPKSFRNGIDGYYPSIWQVNSYRRIVATEPGLTTLPGWEFGQGIMRLFYESFQPYGNLTAYDLIDRMEGLKIGDKVRMSVHNPLYNVTPNNLPNTMGWPRRFVVSARPEGIVGKVIARELETYSGPNGTTVVNRYANNAVTIATERGSVVRGKSIGGRVFMEFMDTDINTVYLQEDADKTRISNWSQDPRRYKEIVAVFTNTRSVTRGDTTREISRTDYFIDTEDGKYVNRPYYSMNARGLSWLEDASTLPAGDVKVYAPSLELSLKTVAPKARFLRNVSSKVIGAMRVDLEMRNTANFKGPNVTIKALPMVLNLKMNGFGKKIKVEGPMTLDLVMPDAQADAGGDRIYVYLDSDRNTKLYLKEDE